MTCDQFIARAARHAAGILGNRETAGFHEHLRGCPICRERLGKIRLAIHLSTENGCDVCVEIVSRSGPGRIDASRCAV